MNDESIDLEKSVQRLYLEFCEQHSTDDWFDELKQLSLEQLFDKFYKHMENKNNVLMLQICCKEDALCAKFRAVGMHFYCQKDLLTAYNCFSKAMCYARSGEGREMALTLAQRSLVNFDLCNYDATVTDIDATLSKDYEKETSHTLYDRRATCMIRLGKADQATANWSKALHVCHEYKLEERAIHYQSMLDMSPDAYKDEIKLSISEKLKFTPFEEEMATVPFQRNTKYPALCHSLNVSGKKNSRRGRYVTSKRDLPPGTLLSVEYPYASVPTNKLQYMYCSFCQKRCFSSIPCLICNSGVFCDSKCMSKLMKYATKKRCICMTELYYMIDADKLDVLACRTFMQSLVDAHLPTDDEHYASTDFSNVIGLVTNADLRSGRDLCRRTIKSVLLMCALNFLFDDDFSLLGGRLASLLMIMPCNAHSLSSLEFDLSATAAEMDVKLSLLAQSQEIGCGIYPTLSLFNHACFPTAVRHNFGHAIQQRTQRRVGRGEEVSDNYGILSPVHTLQQRRAYLGEQYLFECRCHDCEKDAPLYHNLDRVPIAWLCRKCRAPLTNKLGDMSLKCGVCKLILPVRQQNDLLNKYGDFKHIYALMNTDISASVDYILECLTAVALHTVQPNYISYGYVEFLKQCYCIRGQCYDLKLSSQ